MEIGGAAPIPQPARCEILGTSVLFIFLWHSFFIIKNAVPAANQLALCLLSQASKWDGRREKSIVLGGLEGVIGTTEDWDET